MTQPELFQIVNKKQFDLDITVLEKFRKTLINLQKKVLSNINVRWISDIKKLSWEPHIIIANDFFDALPINQYV